MPSFTAPYTGLRSNIIWDTNYPQVLNSPIFHSPNESIAYTVTVKGSNPPSSPSVVAVYRNGTDLKSTVMPSGSASASGQVITLPALTAIVGGSDYIIILTATIASQTYECQILVHGINNKKII